MRIFSFETPQTEVYAPRIILTGREEVLIEQHQGLFSYETGCIRVRTRDGLVTISGEKLIISFFGAQDLQIRGLISGVTIDGSIT